MLTVEMLLGRECRFADVTRINMKEVSFPMVYPYGYMLRHHAVPTYFQEMTGDGR